MTDEEREAPALLGLEVAAGQWPAEVMCRLLLPVPIREMGAIATALAKVARKAGKDARMRQVGNLLEIFTVPITKTCSSHD